MAAEIAAGVAAVEGAQGIVEWVGGLFAAGDPAENVARWEAELEAALERARTAAEAGARQKGAKAVYSFATAAGALQAAAALLEHPTAQKYVGGALQRRWIPAYNATAAYVQAIEAEHAAGGPTAAQPATFDAMSVTGDEAMYRRAAALGAAGPEVRDQVLRDYPQIAQWLMATHPDRAPAWLAEQWAASPQAHLGGAGPVGAADVEGRLSIGTWTILGALALWLLLRR